MRRVVLSVLSMSVVALLMAQPTVAAKSTVYLTDTVGDTCHFIWYPWYGNNFMPDVDYLDVTAAWMTLRNEKLTAGIEVVAPIYVEDGLPQGVERIWYTWYFYVEPEPGVDYAGYGLHVSWDGDTFYAFVVESDPEIAHQCHVMEYLNKSVRVHDNVVEVDLDATLLPGATAWFYEVLVFTIVPEDDYLLDTIGKWCNYCIDITDGPTEYLQWQPMPS